MTCENFVPSEEWTNFKATFILNLSTQDPAAADAFFRAIGFKFVALWGDEKSKTFLLPVPNDNICLMLHAPSRFSEFIRPGSEITDAKKSTEAILSISVKSVEEVDQWLAKASEAGATLDPYVIPNYGNDMNMYTRSFADLDGHIWEVLTDVVKPEEKKD